MEDLKSAYEEILTKREGLLKKIKTLSNDEKVKKYFELCKRNESLAKDQKDLYRKIKTKEYATCQHIWVNTLNDYDSFEGRSSSYVGCVKCGLDKRVLYYAARYYDSDLLPFEQKIMYDSLENHRHSNGTNTHILCDLSLAKAIYVKIKETHPDIDDETSIKYLKAALYNMRYKDTSEERKNNRIKRLSLDPTFNKWNGYDIIRK